MENSKKEDVKKQTSSDEIINKKRDPSLDTDDTDLESLAHKVFIFLGLIIILCGILIGFRVQLTISLVWVCMIAGVLGSTSSALISALQRKANGWEYKDGIKHPNSDSKEGKRDRFSQRMATFFVYRPIFGIIAGLLIYFGADAKFLGDMNVTEMNVTEESKVIFLSILSGLFIKSLIEKLKDLFDNLIGNGK